METPRLDELLEECGGMDKDWADLRDLAATELAALRSRLSALEDAQNELEAFRAFLTEAEIIADMFGYFHVLVGIRTFLAEHPEEK